MYIKEYGGYLPLELGRHGEYFQQKTSAIRRYNCARTAIAEAAKEKKATKVLLPYFICHTVTAALEQAGIGVEKYFLNEKMLPRDQKTLEAANGDAVILLVNYFGMLDREIQYLQSGLQSVIIDNSQAFFAPPIMRQGVSNIYSCRKFVGVPDGAYLIEEGCTAPELEPGTSWKYSEFLCYSLECGTNAAYMKNLENESRLEKERCGMSALTRAILCGAPYDLIQQSRRNNFAQIDGFLGKTNGMKYNLRETIPYVYPYYRKNQGEHIREELLKQHIYTPTLWRECLSECSPETLEYQWSRDVVYLPLDQRYDGNDMSRIAHAVLDILH